VSRNGRRIRGGLRRIGACWRQLCRPKKGPPVLTLLEEWKAHCITIIQAAERILRADVTITDKGFADPNFMALALLIRTVSNLKGAMILLDARRIVEARMITRSCLENLYWTVGLYEEGDKFVGQMRDDEINYRKFTGQAIFASGASLGDEVEARLRNYLRDAAKIDIGKKTLSPKTVAALRPDFKKTYIFYAQLSMDAAHPSVTTLSRYVVSDPSGVGFDVEPLVRAKEIAETYEYLSMACTGICVAVNEMIVANVDLTPGADKHSALSNASAQHAAP
jgi:hypothetical protein